MSNTQRKVHGWTAYADHMKKEYGWGLKELRENPWNSLSDEEKQRWNINAKPLTVPGWCAYVNHMKKEHGWNRKEVSENAPWRGLSDEEKQRWEIIAIQMQQEKLATATPLTVSGSSAYVTHMEKEHGWNWKEVMENAPWSGLSNEEKQRWGTIVAQKQQEKSLLLAKYLATLELPS